MGKKERQGIRLHLRAQISITYVSRYATVQGPSGSRRLGEWNTHLEQTTCPLAECSCRSCKCSQRPRVLHRRDAGRVCTQQ